MALKLLNVSTLGFLGALAFLGYVPLPGWHRAFAFSGLAGLFGLIGAVFLVERAARRKAKVPLFDTGSRGTQVLARARWPMVGLSLIGILSWLAIALFVLLPGAIPLDGLRPVLLLFAPLAAMLVVLLRRNLRNALPAVPTGQGPAGRRDWTQSLNVAALLIAGLSILAVVLLQALPVRIPAPNLTVSGTVKDAVTGRPIAGARVSDNRYGADAHHAPQESWTDASGRFSLRTWYGEHSLAASAAGYQTKLTPLLTRVFRRVSEVRMDFELQPVNPPPAARSLQEITIPRRLQPTSNAAHATEPTNQ